METFETQGHTTREGRLNLSLNIGHPDADVRVVVQVSPLVAPAVPGWPLEYFTKVAGSMPDLERAPQGESEQRPPIG
ncbi:MAG: hypothetical protein GC168_11990 [Candidatus Hydrogenedens sp.]|nr:hypothetical protein [Candidatus Hydrogenedens sp.]